MTSKIATLGIDVGSTCVKAVLHDGDCILGRAVVPVRGLYQDCAQEALVQVLDDAQISDPGSTLTCATGFAAECAPWANMSYSIVSCLTLGAFSAHPHEMSLVDLGGEDPKIIRIDDQGRRLEVASLRKCAAGSGLFLELVARRLSVHPSQLQSLAGQSVEAATIGSYCSVFALNQVDEQLRDGASPSEVASGALESVAERIVESGGFVSPLMVSGGVAEYYPGVLQALARFSGMSVKALPEPITVGALGAALRAQQVVREGNPGDSWSMQLR